MACVHACGSTTWCARGGSLWNKGPRQGCVLAPLLFNIFFAVVIYTWSTRVSRAGRDIMDALVHLKKKTREGGQGEATAEEPALATPHRGMLYADDAGVIS